VKYLVAMTVIAGSAAVCCCNGQVRQGVCGDVTADAGEHDTVGAPSAKSRAGSTGRGRDRSSKKAGAESVADSLVRFREKDAAASAGGSKSVAKSADVLSAKDLAHLDELILDLRSQFDAHKTQIEAAIRELSSSVTIAATSTAQLKGRVAKMEGRLDTLLRDLYGEQIQLQAATAARDAVSVAITGKAVARPKPGRG